MDIEITKLITTFSTQKSYNRDEMAEIKIYSDGYNYSMLVDDEFVELERDEIKEITLDLGGFQTTQGTNKLLDIYFHAIS